MKYRTRTYFTDAQKALMWERWKQGWTLHQIAHLFDRTHGSIRGIFERTGGFRAPQRSRCPIALTLAEREEISRSVAEGQSIRSTAARLGRAPSTRCHAIHGRSSLHESLLRAERDHADSQWADRTLCNARRRARRRADGELWRDAPRRALGLPLRSAAMQWAPLGLARLQRRSASVRLQAPVIDLCARPN
jgi:IS30 family transposase